MESAVEAWKRDHEGQAWRALEGAKPTVLVEPRLECRHGIKCKQTGAKEKNEKWERKLDKDTNE